MSTVTTAISAELLGFPPDARALIVNNDDFGMYHAINVAVVESIKHLDAGLTPTHLDWHCLADGG